MIGVPVYRNKVFWCAIAAVAILVSGVAYGYAASNISVVSAKGTVYVHSRITFSAFSGSSCYPAEWPEEAVISIPLYESLVKLSASELNITHYLTSSCLVGYAFCLSEQSFGVQCDLSSAYPPADSTPIPVGLNVLGYVADITIGLNNRLPIQVLSVNSTSVEPTQASFVAFACKASCSISTNVTLIDTMHPVNVTLTIDASTPVTWFEWGNVGMTQKTMTVSFEFDPTNLTIEF